MSEVIKNKYLDFSGLQKYDKLIKEYIASGNNALAEAIAALDSKIGDLDFEGSDGKTLAEIIESIYSSIADIVAEQMALEEKDAELEGKINDIIGDLESLEGSDVDSVMTLVEICNKLKALEDSVNKNTKDIAAVETRVDILEKTVDDLGKIDGGEGIAGVVEKVNANASAINILNGEGEGSVKKTVADAAAQALADAKADAESKYQLKGDYEIAGTAAGLNAAMDERVTKLEDIDHEQLAADASAAAVAAIVAGADSDFDTLKDVADWIGSHKEGAAELQTTVSSHTDSLKTINDDLDALESKVDGDIKNLSDHMTAADAALGEVDGRLDVLEQFVETHESISEEEITKLFS